MFLPFAEFPWFRDAPIGHLVNVDLPQPHHLYWRDLDVDLHIDSIEDPERYRLSAKDRRTSACSGRVGPSRALQGKASAVLEPAADAHIRYLA